MGKTFAVADAGNTRIKCGVFENQQLKSSAAFSEWGTDLVSFMREAGANTLFLSTVIDVPPAFLQQPGFTIVTLGPQHILPVQNHYYTPQTLGADRLTNACGAWVQNGSKGPVLSIDMGTCIKYDVVNANGQYLGGGISPGLQMRLKALQHYTQKLPLVSPQGIPALVGQNTADSISSGVINGIIAEVEGLVERYERDFPGIKVFLTGGDAAFFSGSLKNNIFAIPFLTLHGLNAIAQMNGIAE